MMTLLLLMGAVFFTGFTGKKIADATGAGGFVFGLFLFSLAWDVIMLSAALVIIQKGAR